MAENFAHFNLYGVVAIQFGYDIVRISFLTETGYNQAMKKKGMHLFDACCQIVGGGPPTTIVHVFDYPHEESDLAVEKVISDFGDVKCLKRQKYLSDNSIYPNSSCLCCFVFFPTLLPKKH